MFSSLVQLPPGADWLSTLAGLLASTKSESINFKSVSFAGLGMAAGLTGDNRLLFMPHSPGIYMALVLKDAAALERDQEDSGIELQSQLSSYVSLSEDILSQPKHQYIQNHLFLDLSSLSKSFQTILQKFMMLVIARIESVERVQATKQANPYGLELGTVFYQCKIKKIENIVGFEGDDFAITNYQCAGYKSH